jgi:hypothetical protein
MCAKRGTPATVVFVGDEDGVDDADLDDVLLGDAVAAPVPVVGLPNGVGGADDAPGGDATADDASVGDATADDASVADADAASDVAVAGTWLTSADALELRGWEPVHPDTTRARAAATDHRATLTPVITDRPCSEVRSARATPHRQPLRSHRLHMGHAADAWHVPSAVAQVRGVGVHGGGQRRQTR